MLYVLTSNCFENAGHLIGVFDTYDLAYEALKDFVYTEFNDAFLDEIDKGYWIASSKGKDYWPYHFYIESCYPNTSLC